MIHKSVEYIVQVYDPRHGCWHSLGDDGISSSLEGARCLRADAMAEDKRADMGRPQCRYRILRLATVEQTRVIESM